MSDDSDSVTLDQHIGARIRLRRRTLGMSQNALAGTLDVSFQQLQKYETGANRVSASALWRIAGSLDVSIGYFFEGLRPEQRLKSDNVTRFLQTREGAELAEVFTAVDDPRVRGAMLKLLRSFAEPPEA